MVRGSCETASIDRTRGAAYSGPLRCLDAALRSRMDRNCDVRTFSVQRKVIVAAFGTRTGFAGEAGYVAR